MKTQPTNVKPDQPAESKACASVGVEPADAQIDAITQEWAGSIEVPRLRLDLCREYARRT